MNAETNAGRGSGQRRLFPSTAQEKFEEFDSAHPEIYAWLVDRARQVKARGFKKYGLRTLWEMARWHSDVGDLAHSDGSDFKLNNNWPPYYARKIMAHEPDLRGFFELRGFRPYDPPAGRVQ